MAHPDPKYSQLQWAERPFRDDEFRTVIVPDPKALWCNGVTRTGRGQWAKGPEGVRRTGTSRGAGSATGQSQGGVAG